MASGFRRDIWGRMSAKAGKEYISPISAPLSSHKCVVVGSYRAVGAYCQLPAHSFLPYTTLYYPVRLVYGVLDPEMGN